MLDDKDVLVYESDTPSVAALAPLEAIYEAHHRTALGIAYQLVGNRHEAEEIVQEAFLAIWRAYRQFDPSRGSDRTWVLSVVRNKAVDALRARARRPPRALPSMDRAYTYRSRQPDIASCATDAVDREQMLGALRQLPEGQRQVIELAYFVGLSQAEIARLLDLPAGTVKGRIRLALDHLRGVLAAWLPEGAAVSN